MEGYTALVGAGGSSVVYKHDRHAIVVKLSVEDTTTEHATHNHVYKVVSQFVSEMRPCQLQIAIPRPMQFLTSSRVFDEQSAYTMQYLFPVDACPSVNNAKEMVHVVLNAQYETMLDRRVGVRYEVPITHADNPSRGYFASSRLLTERLLPSIPAIQRKLLHSVYDLSHRIGLLFGLMVFAAEVMPRDVEYCLAYESDTNDSPLVMCAMDFGMASPIDYVTATAAEIIADLTSTVLETDLYYPAPNDPYASSFLSGVQDAYDYAHTRTRSVRVADTKLQVLLALTAYDADAAQRNSARRPIHR